MGEVSYRPLIEDMVWSYSRVSCFEQCPYKFYTKYIYGQEEQEMFYASYGKFMHKLIEEYYKEGTSREDLKIKFLFDFSKEVKGFRPSDKIVRDYLEKGCNYFDTLEPFPFNMISVEEKVEFNIDGIPFVGVIDYFGEVDGEYVIVDNKSRDLKPRSARKKPTLKDMELDSMLKQLYVYSAWVYQKYGKYPKYLCFNCFKENVFIKEEFNIDKYNETIGWVKGVINMAMDEDKFPPYVDFFPCYYLCGFNEECDYWLCR